MVVCAASADAGLVHGPFRACCILASASRGAVYCAPCTRMRQLLVKPFRILCAL